MNKEKITSIFMDKLSQWEASPERMTSGYAYEKTYVQAMKKIEEEVFKEILQGENNGGVEKKTPYDSGRNKGKR
jgi:hypothetical protein